MAQGPLIIVSGPAGCGKTTVINRLLQEGGVPLRRSISVTTRARRKGEEDGKDYYFWTREKFLAERDRDAFLEWAEVHGQGQYYGTPKSEVDPRRASGIGVILVIDVQGAAQVRKQYPEAFSVFLKAPADEEYRRRLLKRGSEDDKTIAVRLETAKKELARAGEYDCILVSDQIERTVDELRDLIIQQFLKGESMLDELKEEAIVNKVGGRFKLSTLIQKRMIALNQGARPLVDLRSADKLAIVVQEILQDKIYLDVSTGQVQTRNPSQGEPARRTFIPEAANNGE